MVNKEPTIGHHRVFLQFSIRHLVAPSSQLQDIHTWGCHFCPSYKWERKHYLNQGNMFVFAKMIMTHAKIILN